MKFIRTAVWLISLATSLLTMTAAPRPNVVFILADDLGWTDLGCYGSTFYETPNLDRLAQEGMRFTDAYAACNVCSPTRASIMTGKYPGRLHLTDWLDGRTDRPDQKLNRPHFQMFLPLGEVTLAEALKEAGYQTAFVGKWHLGESPDYWPEHQGFDLNIGGCGQGHPLSYFSPYKNPALSDGPKGEYLNDRLTDEALKFLDHAAQQDRPFLLYFSQYAVHTPLQAKPEMIEKYRAKAAKLTPSGPEFLSDLGRQVRQVQNHPIYGAMVESLDESVGRVLAKLRELHLDENTIVIFTSDNGGLSTAENTPTANVPLRAGKGWPYEGGVREPLLVKWPGVTRPGSVSHGAMISTDYYPTLLEMLGLPARLQQHLDGESFVPLLQGGNRAERPLFWHYPHYSNQGGAPHGAVRLGDFKLIEWFEDMRVELYNLHDDLGEHHDLSRENPAKTAELTQLLHDWRKQVDAQMPTPNPDYRPADKNAAGKKKVAAKNASRPASAAAPGVLRQHISLDANWRFHLGDVPEAKAPTFDDSAWRALDVPHDWSIEGDYAATNPTGDRSGWLPSGIGWYRHVIDMPAEWQGRVVTAEFDGVYMNSTVWLNGEQVGGRPYGYSSFTCDLTAQLKPGRNVLAVRVDNSLEPSARWYHGCGIYGDVALSVTDPVRIAPNGIFVSTPTVTANEAEVRVRTSVLRPAGAAPTAVRTTLRDPAGRVVAENVSTAQPIEAVDATVFEQTLAVKAPQRWSLESPSLYTAVSTVLADGKPMDAVETTFGIRTLRFDANEGFFLNDRHVKLQGVCEHQGASPVGAAMPTALLERRLRQLQAMGCNAIRAAHNPQLPAFYELCDRLGILVMDEIFDGWHKKADQDYGRQAFAEWWRRDVTDWIERDRNHPSVILWSIGNETGKTDTNGITQLIHSLDATRPTTGGSVIYGVDVAGFNGGIVPNDKVLEDFHRDHPAQPIVMTEEPHTFQTRGFYRTVNNVFGAMDALPDYASPEVFSGGHPAYRSSYDNCGRRLLARNAWQRTASRPWVMGEFRWTGFDYLGEAGWAGKASLAREFNFGVLDLAGFPKDLYYFYQSIWTEPPMVHLLPDWTYPGLEGKVIPVVAYANADEVELFQDGRSLGRQPRSALFECVWPVTYKPGVLKAVAYRGGQPVAETSQRTAGVAARLELTTDNAALRPDRGDVALVTMTICDADGIFAPHADNRIDLALTGPARWLGGENGDPVDITPQRETGRKVFAGLARGFYAGVDGANGPIEVAALGLLGPSFFEKTAHVTLAFERVALRGELSAAPVEIHYTVDGSVPTAASPRYAGPWDLSDTTTVRAVVFREGKPLVSTTAVFTKGREPVLVEPDTARGDMGAAEDPTQVKGKGKRKKQN